jgi:hypothetical protein
VGDVRVSPTLLGVGLACGTDAQQTFLMPRAGLGFALAHVATRGDAAAPNRSHDAESWLGGGYGLLGRASSGAEAAAWFETYLREEPQGLLAREASGRLIESYRGAGNLGAAHGAASRYLARYPDGPHAAIARQALAARSESRD